MEVRGVTEVIRSDHPLTSITPSSSPCPSVFSVTSVVKPSEERK
jgi:hypothetical protein